MEDIIEFSHNLNADYIVRDAKYQPKNIIEKPIIFPVEKKKVVKKAKIQKPPPTKTILELYDKNLVEDIKTTINFSITDGKKLSIKWIKEQYTKLNIPITFGAKRSELIKNLCNSVGIDPKQCK